MILYTILQKMNKICMFNDNNKHFGKIEKKNALDQHWG